MYSYFKKDINHLQNKIDEIQSELARDISINRSDIVELKDKVIIIENSISLNKSGDGMSDQHAKYIVEDTEKIKKELKFFEKLCIINSIFIMGFLLFNFT